MYLESIYDEWLYAVCSSSLLFGISIMKKCVVSSLTSFGTLEYESLTKKEKYLIFFL